MRKHTRLRQAHTCALLSENSRGWELRRTPRDTSLRTFDECVHRRSIQYENTEIARGTREGRRPSREGTYSRLTNHTQGHTHAHTSKKISYDGVQRLVKRQSAQDRYRQCCTGILLTTIKRLRNDYIFVSRCKDSCSPSIITDILNVLSAVVLAVISLTSSH